MAVTKERKVEIMNDLVAKFKDAKSIGFATTNTITVEEFAALRKNLREVNATYTLAKKTIIKKAIKEATWLDLDLSELPGQIWVVCSNEDPMEWLGKLNAFMKEANGPKGDKGKMAWAISIFEWELKSADETKVLASMPSRDTLLWRLVWSMKSPISALARFFDAASKELEKTWKATVWELDWKAVAEPVKTEEKPVEEVKVEETKTEEVKEEVKEEAPAEEKVEAPKAETPTEETEAKAEEIVETPVEENKVEEAEAEVEEAKDWESEEKKAE